MKEKRIEAAREIAQFIAEARFSKIPGPVIQRAKNCILDALGCGLYGREFEASKIVTQVVQEWGGRPESTILGTGLKVPSGMAALANGIAIHVADYDDSSVLFRGHPTSVVLPPVLALSEARGATGEDLLLAYIVGVEVGGKLGKIMGWSHYEAGWHGTGTIGTIAAAAASAKILRLNEERTAHGLAIAVSETSGVRENFGTMVKSFHAGQASAAGVLAAVLAEKGYSGSMSAFEGGSGFRRVFSGESEMTRWAEELGQPYALLDIGFKRYPSCACTHTSLDALEELMSSHPFSWKEIEEVSCTVPFVIPTILIYPDPQNSLEAKFSLPYCLASFLVHGRLDLSHFEKEALFDANVRALMPKVKLVPSMDMENRMKSENLLAPVEVSVKLKNGTLKKMFPEAKGGPSLPPSVGEVKEKFRTCAGRLLSLEKVEHGIGLVSTLESLREVNQLTEVLCP
jgi:2-methylcitrate dehydratase PrpD